MQSTPTKKQATQNGILPLSTPERQPGDTRGQMASYTPEDLKAQLASRPRSVRSSVSQGYARAPLTPHRSEPNMMPGYSLPTSASPSLSPSRPLMPMCDTLSSYSGSPHSSAASLSNYNSTFSILARAHEAHLMHNNWSPSSSSSLSSARPSPRKRGQLDNDDDEEEEGATLALGMGGMVGAKAYDDSMDERAEGEETMMMDDEQDDNDLPLSRSARRLFHQQQQQQRQDQVPPLSFGNHGMNSGSSSSASSSSSSSSNMFFPSPSSQAQAQQSRQMKTMPRRALCKTQSLPVEAFMPQFGMDTQNARQGIQQFVPDVFNATDGF